MLIAVCLSGGSLAAAYCRPYIQRFFRGHQVDYFIHAWPDDTAHLPLYNPKAVSSALPPDLIEKERNVITTFRDASFIDLIVMYWGVSQAIKLVPETGYDLVVRIRPDLIPLQRLNFTLSTFDPTAVYFAYHMERPMRDWQPPAGSSGMEANMVGYHDGLIFGTPDLMRHFGSSYDLIDTFCHSYAELRFRPAFYLHFLIATGIANPKRAPISYHLVDEAQARKPLALYEPQRQGADHSLALVQRHPDIAAHLDKMPSPLNRIEHLFESGWSGVKRPDGSPSLSPSMRRLARKRYQGAV